MKAFKRSRIVSALVGIMLVAAVLTGPLAAAPDNQGVEFILGFLENC